MATFSTDFLVRKISFPLYKDDGEPIFRLVEKQKEAQKLLNWKITSQVYGEIENHCLCANENESDDIVLAEKDLIGISVKNILCGKCGLIRSDKVFDTKSMAQFYGNEYNILYYGSAQPNEKFFQSQVERGNGFYELIRVIGLLDDIENVFEIGCNMGGNMFPFFLNKKTVSGCDYAKEYVEFGKAKGLNLYAGEVDDIRTPDGSQDLVILSHVMEHFADPIGYICSITRKIKPGKYLLIEVPGVFADNPYPYYPIWHLQKAHVFNFFYKEYLDVFFSSFGYEILYGDERCTFVLKKRIDQHSGRPTSIYDRRLEGYPARIENHFKERYLRLDYFRFLNKVRVKKRIRNVFTSLGLLKD